MTKPRKSPRRPVRATAIPAPAADLVPVPTRRRHDGWTPEKQLAFLEALAACGCVEEACGAVGISRQSAYRLYARTDAQPFRLAWDRALDFAIRRLTEACTSRALHGTPVPHFYKGEQVGEHRRYDNRLAIFLLRYRDPLRYAATLDQMVYSGHPEAAALAFARAREAAADAAYGISPAPPAAPDAGDRAAEAEPWSMRAADVVAAEALKAVLVEGDAAIGGTHARRTRIEELRALHRADRGDAWREDSDEAFVAWSRGFGQGFDAAKRDKASGG